jgi:hypothetical protein
MTPLLRMIDRAYRMLLRGYPQPFRNEFGPLIAQAFRDHCREAHRRSGTGGVLRLLPAMFYDLFRTSVHEHLTHHSLMNMFQSPQRTSNFLLCAGIGVGFLSLAFYKVPATLLAAFYLCAAIFLARAFVEWKRPHAEWWKSILTGLVIFIAFAFFMPAWAKMRAMHGLGPDTHAPAAFAAMFANLIVALAKTAIHFLRRRVV